MVKEFLLTPALSPLREREFLDGLYGRVETAMAPGPTWVPMAEPIWTV